MGSHEELYTPLTYWTFFLWRFRRTIHSANKQLQQSETCSWFYEAKITPKCTLHSGRIDHWTAVDSSGQEKRCHSALQTAGQMDGVGVVKIIRRVCTVHAWRMCVTVVVCWCIHITAAAAAAAAADPTCSSLPPSLSLRLWHPSSEPLPQVRGVAIPRINEAAVPQLPVTACFNTNCTVHENPQISLCNIS